MIRNSTIVYLVLLLALVGAYFFLRNREKPADADIELTLEPQAEVSYLFSAEEGTPSGIRLEAQSGETVEVARDANNAWVLKQPVEAKADPGAAEAAATQVVTMQVLDTVPDIDTSLVGLDVPQYVLDITFASGAEQTLEIGILTPSESGYYVRKADGEVIIVSRSAIDALLGLLQNPPYLETPTPSPVPAIVTSTPIPTRETPASPTATP